MICNGRVCAHHIYLVVAAFIVVYGVYLKRTGSSDVLQTRFARCAGCDLWALTHFIMYAILGFLFPDYIFLFFLVGVGYELFEQWAGTAELDLGNRSWWYGRVSDVFFNWAGLVTGSAIHAARHRG